MHVSVDPLEGLNLALATHEYALCRNAESYGMDSMCQ